VIVSSSHRKSKQKSAVKENVVKKSFRLFLAGFRYVSKALLKLAEANPRRYAAIPIDGCGMMAMEATIKTFYGGESKKASFLSRKINCL